MVAEGCIAPMEIRSSKAESQEPIGSSPCMKHSPKELRHLDSASNGGWGEVFFSIKTRGFPGSMPGAEAYRGAGGEAGALL